MTLDKIIASLPTTATIVIGARVIRQGARHAAIYALVQHGTGHYSARRV